MSGNPTDHTIRSGTQLDHPEDRTVLADDDPRHGTLNAYVNHRCRCEPCRAARRSYGIERGELTGTGPRRATGPDAARINAAATAARIRSLLKQHGAVLVGLWRHTIAPAAVAPNTLKKYATGHGHSDKDAMKWAAVRQFGPVAFGLGPDAIDALWVASWARTNAIETFGGCA